jgi:hypothetical protein
MRLLIIIAFFILSFSLFSQIENDTTFDLNSLPEYNPDEFEPDFTIETKKGWFPLPVASYYSYGIATGTSLMMYENETAISSKAFSAPFDFSGDNIMTKNQRRIDKKFKKSQYNNFPLKNFEKYSLTSKFAIKNFTWVRFDVAYVIYRGLLMHRLDDKYFFPVGENELKKIKEVALISNTDHGINFALGFQVPFWGGIINEGGNITEAFYYLYAGINNTQVISSNTKQFYQLATYNNEIRYRNGKDTIGIGGNKLSTLNYSRHYLDFGIGTSLDITAAGFSMGYSAQLIYSYPLTSVISDGNWKQHSIRFEVLIFTKGLFRELFGN